jgi:hypothetical protein
MDFAGLYGRGWERTAPEETASAQSSGPPMANSRPALFWVAIVGILIGTRLLWEYAG